MAKTDLTNQRQVFVEEYVRSGDHLEAAKKAGYKDTHTLRNQACKLRREYADQITDELHRNFAEIALSALCMMSSLRAIPPALRAPVSQSSPKYLPNAN